MICPKCKKYIPNGILKCDNCGTRVAIVCPKCRSHNPIYNLTCDNCNNELLKLCPQCKSVNLPSAEKCRKCGLVFPPKVETIEIIEEEPIDVDDENIEETEVEDIESSEISDEKIENAINQDKDERPISEEKPKAQAQKDIVVTPEDLVYNADFLSQQKANEVLVKGILSNKTKIIAINGKSGVGKTMVIKSAINQLKDDKLVWFYGVCSDLTQLTPCGFIQDLLLTFFNIPDFCQDGVKIQKESQRFFHSEFPLLSNKEVFDLLNFLYPTKPDYYENILQNKDRTFSFLEKVFRTIIEKNNTIFVVENFEMIDGISYEFLSSLVNSDLINQPVKFILTYNEPKPVRGYLYNNELKDKAYLDISLNNFDKNQMDLYIEQSFKDETCPENAKEVLASLSGGNPAVLEQYTSLLLDYKKFNGSYDITFPSTINAVVKMRLDFLNKDNLNAYKALSLAAIQGVKFSPQIINHILGMDDAAFSEVLMSLDSANFIMPVSENYFTFKNSALWQDVSECIKYDEAFMSYNEALYTLYSNFIMSSHSLRAILAENLGQDVQALSIWTDNIKLAAYIGDVNLYVISQKQSLVLVERIGNLGNGQLIKNNIYERLGKLLSGINPKEAADYLPNAINNSKLSQDITKEIELTAYLANCCLKTGNYYGVIECVDAVCAKLEPDMDLELAMLKSRKAEALLKIGNCGEIVNLVDNEILPVFDKYINAKPHKTIPITSLYKAWLQTYLNLAIALSLQGNTRAFDVIATLFELFEKNNFTENIFICKTKLALAFANTVKGNIEASENLLSEIIKNYSTDDLDDETISRFNIVNILNNFISKKNEEIKEDLYQVVTFANNANDNFTKNILKTFLGKIFKDDENAKHALDIYSDEITYFSKEKNAIGALLCWYLIADAKLVAEGPENAIEVASKALEVAQSPKINNYIFITLYNKLIAESYIILGDYEMAKIHIEKAIVVAKNFDLLTLLAELYHLYGKYLQDIVTVKKEVKIDYVTGALKMYKKAEMLAQAIKNNYILEDVEKSKKALNAFCKLNGISLSHY